MGVLAGVLTSVILSFIGALMLAFGFERSVGELNMYTYIFALISGLIIQAAAGFVTARMSYSSKFYNACLLGIIGLIFSIGYEGFSSSPLWFTIFNSVLIIPATLIGAYFESRMYQSRQWHSHRIRLLRYMYHLIRAIGIVIVSCLLWRTYREKILFLYFVIALVELIVSCWEYYSENHLQLTNALMVINSRSIFLMHSALLVIFISILVFQLFDHLDRRRRTDPSQE